jgi:hypothetical protein
MSAPQLQIEIKHNQAMAAFMLVCALFILGTGFVIGFSLNTVTGVIILLVSIGYFTQPAVVVTETGLEHRNLFGMTLRRTDYDSLSDLSVEPDGSFWLTRGGTKEKVRGMIRFLLSGTDVKRFEDAIRAAKGPREDNRSE